MGLRPGTAGQCWPGRAACFYIKIMDLGEAGQEVMEDQPSIRDAEIIGRRRWPGVGARNHGTFSCKTTHGQWHDHSSGGCLLVLSSSLASSDSESESRPSLAGRRRVLCGHRRRRGGAAVVLTEWTVTCDPPGREFVICNGSEVCNAFQRLHREHRPRLTGMMQG